MQLKETNNLKKNVNLTEHFLYTYSSYDKTGPQDNVRLTFNEDLIFDRSRRSIFTQSQEFGYVSDTVYTMFINKDVSSYLTLRSYEGSIEMYQYNPFAIKNITYSLETNEGGTKYPAVVNHIYEAGKNVKFRTFNVAYNGNDDEVVYSYIAINDNIKIQEKPITESNRILFAPSKFTTSTEETLNLGENIITFFAYSVKNTYQNFNENDIHRTNPRFQKENHFSYSLLSFKIIAYNPTYLLKLPETYWSAYDKYKVNNNAVSITPTNMMIGLFSDDWGCMTYNNHYLCDNGKGETLALVVPTRLQNNEIIYGMVGGSSQEFYKLKTFNLPCGIPENYNLYVATSDNWNGQELWFYPR